MKKIMTICGAILLIASISLTSCGSSGEKDVQNLITKERFFYLGTDLKRENAHWISDCKFNTDKSFNINCYLTNDCGNYMLKGDYGNIEKYDFDKSPYDFQKQFSYLDEGVYYKIPLNFTEKHSIGCEWDIAQQKHFLSEDMNPIINFKRYSFALIAKDEESDIWRIHLYTSFNNGSTGEPIINSWELITKSDRIKGITGFLEKYGDDVEMKKELEIVKKW
jgi:hypothetical protein